MTATTLPTATIRTQLSLPMEFADGFRATARVFTFDGLVDGREHIALQLGEPSDPPLVRLHSECLTGDVLGSRRCDCGPQLSESVRRIEAVGGFVLYLRQEGRGIGLYSKLDAYALQDSGLDTFEANLALGYPADERDYAPAAQMIRALGLERIALLSNNPDKYRQLQVNGIDIAEQVATGTHLSPDNARYLAAKVHHAAHTLDLPLTFPA